ncbi:TPA: hypothetical protein MED83_004704 [Klebsiella quasipneumoniae]|nr:hypothetical protein [Klebsiella quasipneumoniae]HCA6898218.1 hypothetical protein [Klebsiella quasipneumoniae]HDE0874090.1 hypothetical protein [Klebsiella quasipneumoniae]
MKIYLTINESFKNYLKPGNDKAFFLKIPDAIPSLFEGLECDLVIVSGSNYICINEFSRILIDKNSNFYNDITEQLYKNGTIEISKLLTAKNNKNFFSQVMSDNSYYQLKDILKTNSKRFLLKIRDIGALSEYKGDVKPNRYILDKLLASLVSFNMH